MPGMRCFDVAAALEVFAHDRTGRGVPRDEVRCVATRSEVTLEHGLRVDAAPLAAAAGADLVLVPGSSRLPNLWETMEQTGGLAVREALLGAHAAGAQVASLCTGAFVLAATGLLDGEVATTHWSACELLAERHPRIRVQPNVLHTRDASGTVWTSAGVSAGIDLCLALHAVAHGAAAAATVARSMVLPTARHGGQAQYVPVRRRPHEKAGVEFEELRATVRAEITRPWALAELARTAQTAPPRPHRARCNGALPPRRGPPRGAGCSASAWRWPASCWRPPGSVSSRSLTVVGSPAPTCYASTSPPTCKPHRPGTAKHLPPPPTRRRDKCTAALGVEPSIQRRPSSEANWVFPGVTTCGCWRQPTASRSW